MTYNVPSSPLNADLYQLDPTGLDAEHIASSGNLNFAMLHRNFGEQMQFLGAAITSTGPDAAYQGLAVMPFNAVATGISDISGPLYRAAGEDGAASRGMLLQSDSGLHNIASSAISQIAHSGTHNHFSDIASNLSVDDSKDTSSTTTINNIQDGHDGTNGNDGSGHDGSNGDNGTGHDGTNGNNGNDGIDGHSPTLPQITLPELDLNVGHDLGLNLGDLTNGLSNTTGHIHIGNLENPGIAADGGTNLNIGNLLGDGTAGITGSASLTPDGLAFDTGIGANSGILGTTVAGSTLGGSLGTDGAELHTGTNLDLPLLSNDTSSIHAGIGFDTTTMAPTIDIGSELPAGLGVGITTDSQGMPNITLDTAVASIGLSQDGGLQLDTNGLQSLLSGAPLTSVLDLPSLDTAQLSHALDLPILNGQPLTSLDLPVLNGQSVISGLEVPVVGDLPLGNLAGPLDSIIDLSGTDGTQGDATDNLLGTLGLSDSTFTPGGTLLTLVDTATAADITTLGDNGLPLANVTNDIGQIVFIDDMPDAVAHLGDSVTAALGGTQLLDTPVPDLSSLPDLTQVNNIVSTVSDTVAAISPADLPLPALDSLALPDLGQIGDNAGSLVDTSSISTLLDTIGAPDNASLPNLSQITGIGTSTIDAVLPALDNLALPDLSQTSDMAALPDIAPVSDAIDSLSNNVANVLDLDLGNAFETPLSAVANNNSADGAATQQSQTAELPSNILSSSDLNIDLSHLFNAADSAVTAVTHPFADIPTVAANTPAAAAEQTAHAAVADISVAADHISHNLLGGLKAGLSGWHG